MSKKGSAATRARGAVKSGPAPTPGAQFLPLALLVLAALILFAPGLTAPFFADDYLFLDFVRRHPLPQGLFAPDPIGNFVRPVSRALWFGTLGPLTGESAWAFHAANLLAIAAVLVLFHRLALRFVGARGAAAGTAFLALHYAIDVPARWASGSQDLLAVAFALAALWLADRGRVLWAAPMLLLALFSKEVVAGTAAVAFTLAWVRGRDLRAAARSTWPLFAATALWAVVWFAARNPASEEAALTLSPAAFAAAAVHALQVVAGAEWEGWRWRVAARDLFAIALAVVAVLVAASGRARRGKGDGADAIARHVATAGVAWTALGVLPIAPVAAIWSAYYYLFALCGVALVLGAWAQARRGAVVAAVVAALGLASAQARGLPTFASTQELWTRHSHVNRQYVERAMSVVSTMLEDLKRLVPDPEPRTMFYFSNLPAFVGFHTADGPVVRWAFRDSSLRSDFTSGFDLDDEHPRPWVFLSFRGGHLVEVTEPGTAFALGVNLTEVGSYAGAEDAFRVSMEREPERVALEPLFLSMLALARGDTARVITLAGGSAWNDRRKATAGELAKTREEALARFGAGDLPGGFDALDRGLAAYPFDPAAHATAADVVIPFAPKGAVAVLEAFSARVLAPEDPEHWRRWAIVMASRNRAGETASAIARYKALGGAATAADTAIARHEAWARSHLPGGAAFDRTLRAGPGPP